MLVTLARETLLLVGLPPLSGVEVLAGGGETEHFPCFLILWNAGTWQAGVLLSDLINAVITIIIKWRKLYSSLKASY